MSNDKTALLTRIELLEKEIAALREKLESQQAQQVTLRGIWKGLDISEQDIEEAKRSLFREVDDI